jgi:septum site-determining protein MinC
MPATGTPGAEELFGTETMAELCVRQGRLDDALAIYRRLVARADDARQPRWQARLSELETQGPSSPSSPTTTTTTTTTTSKPAPEPEVPAAAPPPPSGSLVVRELVRAGQIIYAQGADLIVLASVNPGAQLMADGHIHVYGTLRGRAVAGVRGARDARVFCQRLEAELVGVDVGYVLADDLPPALLGKPAQVLLDGDRCVVKPLI